MKDIDEAIQHCDIDKKLTNRQAIGVLDGLWSNPLFGEAHRQAFEIGIKAIKALEQEPCEDAIGRSDMLDAIGHGTTYTSEELQRIIKGLPPVNPQESNITWVTGADGAKIAFWDVPVWKVIKICEILGKLQESEE